MINTEELEKAIANSGKKKVHLAKACGITPQTFIAKCKNRSDFSLSEVTVLTKELGLSNQDRDRIFFA